MDNTVNVVVSMARYEELLKKELLADYILRKQDSYISSYEASVFKDMLGKRETPEEDFQA